MRVLERSSRRQICRAQLARSCAASQCVMPNAKRCLNRNTPTLHVNFAAGDGGRTCRALHGAPLRKVAKSGAAQAQQGRKTHNALPTWLRSHRQAVLDAMRAHSSVAAVQDVSVACESHVHHATRYASMRLKSKNRLVSRSLAVRP